MVNALFLKPYGERVESRGIVKRYGKNTATESELCFAIAFDSCNCACGCACQIELIDGIVDKVTGTCFGLFEVDGERILADRGDHAVRFACLVELDRRHCGIRSCACFVCVNAVSCSFKRVTFTEQVLVADAFLYELKSCSTCTGNTDNEHIRDP